MLDFSLDSYGCKSFNELSLVQLDLVSDSAEMVFNRHTQELITTRMQSWTSFVRGELVKGGGKLFKYIAKEDQAFLKIDLSRFGGKEFSPCAILQEQSENWSKYWAPPDEISRTSCQEAHEIYREVALPHASGYTFTLSDFRNGLRGYNRSSKGSDCFVAKDLKWFPDIFVTGLAKAMQDSIRKLAMPLQLQLSLNACLGKKEGMRTITLTSLLYSVWNRSQEQVRDWEINNMDEFDTCKPGRSALRAALGRGMQAELAHLLGEKTGGLFHDWEKFFDTININVLLSEALHTDYPPVHMAFAMQQHLAPRMIKLHNFLGKPIEVCNSIIAGCRQSVPFTRVYMKRELKNVCNNYQGILDTADSQTGGLANTALYVDDCAQTFRSSSSAIVFNRLMNSFFLFNKAKERLKLRLSEKRSHCCELPQTCGSAPGRIT